MIIIALLIFSYSVNDISCTLDLITYNPLHQTQFLLHSIKSTGTNDNKLEAVNKMYNYIYKLKKTLGKKDSSLLNYTVNWYNRRLEKFFTSSFYGINIEEVLGKFLYGKEYETHVIHNIKLNPSC